MRDRGIRRHVFHLLLPVALMLVALACRGLPSPMPTGAGAAAATATATILPTQVGPAATPVPTKSEPTATTATSAPAASPSATATRIPTAAAPSATPTQPPTRTSAVLRLARVNAAAWSPDGKVLAIADDRGIHRSDGRTLEERRFISTGAGVSGVAFSPDGRLLAAGTFSNTVQLRDVATGQLTLNLEGPNRPVASAAYNPASARLTDITFSPDGATLAAGVAGYYSGGQGSVWLWKVATGEQFAVLSAYGAVQKVRFSPTGSILAAATQAQTCARGGGGIMMWDAATRQALNAYSDQGNSMSDLAFHPSEPLAAAAGGRGSRCIGPSLVHLWDVRTAQERRVFDQADPATCVAFDSTGSLLASGGQGGAVSLRSVESGQLLRTLEGHTAPVAGVAFSPRDRVLASWSSDGTVRLWELP